MSIQLPGHNVIEFSAEAMRAIIEEHLRRNMAGPAGSPRVTAGPFHVDGGRFRVHVTTDPEKKSE